MVLGGSSSGGRLGTAILDLRANAGPLDRGLERSEKNVRRSTGRMGKAVKFIGLGFAGAGVAAAGVGVASLKLAADFDKAFSEVRTLLPKVSDEAFGALQKDLRDFSNETGTVTTEAIPALYQAISAGVPRENVMDFLRVANKAAVGGVTDLETAVDAITSTVNAYGPEVLSATQASDIMFTAVRLGKTTFDELGAALFNVVPTAASFGVGLDQVSAALAVTTAQGVPTKIATTQLRQAFVEAGKESSILAKTIKERTGKSFSQLIKEGKPVHRIFQDLREDMPEDDFRNLFSSVEAANAALLITGDAAERVDDALAEMSTSAGATDKAFATVADTATFRMQKAMNLMRNVLLEIGLALLPALVEVLDKAVLPALTAFAGWMSDHSDEMAAGVIAVVDAAEELGSATKTAVTESIAAYTRFVTWGENNVDRAKAFWTDTTAAATAHKNEGVVTAQYAYIALLRWGSENKAELVQLWTDTASAASDVKTTINDEVVPAYEGVSEWTATNAETVKGFWKDTETAVADLGTAIDTKVAVPLVAVSTWHTNNKAAILGVWEEANTKVGNLSASISALGDIEVKFPELELPELKAPELPELKAPELLELKAPELFVPKLELPKEPLEKVDLGLGKNIGEDLKTGFEGLDLDLELPSFDATNAGLEDTDAKIAAVSGGMVTLETKLAGIDEGFLRMAGLAAGVGALIIGGPFGLAAMGVSATLLAKNYLPAVRSWFDQNAPGIAALMNPWLVKIEEFSGAAQTKVKEAIDNHVLPALQSVHSWITTNKEFLLGLWTEFSGTIVELGGKIKTNLVDVWNNDVMPVLNTFKQWLEDNKETISAAWGAILNIGGGAVETVFDVLKHAADVILPRIRDVLDTTVMPAIEKFGQWFIDNQDTIREAFDTIGQAAKAFTDTLAFFFDVTWPIAEPILKKMLDIFLDLAGKVATVAAKLDWLAIGLGTALGIWVAWNVAVAIGMGLQAAVTWGAFAAWVAYYHAVLIGGGIMAVATGIIAAFGVAVAIATSPIFLIGLAIVGLIAIGVLLWKNWDKIKEFALRIWENIKNIIKGHWDKILAILFPAVGLPILIFRNWGKITGFVDTIWSKVKDTVTGWIDAIVDYVKKLPGRILEIIKDIPKMVINVVKDIPVIGDAVGAVGGAIGGVVGGFKGIFGGEHGGIVTGPTLTLLGEAGPEAVIPLPNLNLSSLVTDAGAGLAIEELSSLSALSERDFQGQRELHIHVENMYGVDDLEDFVQEANLAALRRGQENVLT